MTENDLKVKSKMSLDLEPFGRIHTGDAIDVLRTLPDQSVNCCVTSPPYWGLRDYGVAGQIGLEETPWLYIERLVAVFDEVKRVLMDDGTLWLNLGDSYSSTFDKRKPWDASGTKQQGNPASMAVPGRSVDGIAPKNLLGMPWRVAFALQDAGWYLRTEIIWHKPNPMPESVKDRPTRAHEYVFLLSKREKYYYDHEAVKEPAAAFSVHDGDRPKIQSSQALSFARKVAEPDRPGQSHTQHRPDRNVKNRNVRPGVDIKGGGQGSGAISYPIYTRNRRSVWTVPTKPFPGAHFATFPPKLIEPCILAGCPMGGIVLDPFFGSGTVGMVAKQLRRQWIGIELNPEYCAMASRRVEGEHVAKALDEELPLMRLMGASILGADAL